MADDKCLHPCYPVLGGRGSQGKPPDHGILNDEIHLPQGRRRALPLQDLEIITVIRLRLTRIRIALLEGLGDFFSNRASPRPICILPRQAVMFSWGADDSLCVLVYLRIVVLFFSVLVLCFDETTTNLNSVQFVSPDAPIQYFLTPYFRIKVPLPFALHDRNRKRKIIVTHHENGAVRIFFIYFNRVLFLCLGCERQRPLFVHHTIFGTDNILAVQAQTSPWGGDTKSLAS